MRHAIALAITLASTPAFAADSKPPADSKPTTTSSTSEKAGKKVEIAVTEAGFEPQEIKLKKGQPATLVFTRKTERTCITAIDIPDEEVKKFKLPLNQPVALTITPKKAGVEKFHCSAMAMGNGRIVVED